MAEHRVPKDNIIYIIPNDELYLMYENGEAFIDDYGRLINSKTHRVLRELKYYAKKTSTVQRRTTPPPNVLNRNDQSMKEYFLEAFREKIMKEGEIWIEKGVDKFVYQIAPNVWHEHIVPGFYHIKSALTSKELTAEKILSQKKLKTRAGMTKEEVESEKRKFLYHWLNMLNSLKRLYEAGEIDDIDETLAQLTDPTMLKRVNDCLKENPNFLETDKYITLHTFLKRDLYEDKQLIPIRAEEITTIAETYGYKVKPEQTEDKEE